MIGCQTLLANIATKQRGKPANNLKEFCDEVLHRPEVVAFCMAQRIILKVWPLDGNYNWICSTTINAAAAEAQGSELGTNMHKPRCVGNGHSYVLTVRYGFFGPKGREQFEHSEAGI